MNQTTTDRRAVAITRLVTTLVTTLVTRLVTTLVTALASTSVAAALVASSTGCSLLGGIHDVRTEGAPCGLDTDCDDENFLCGSDVCARTRIEDARGTLVTVAGGSFSIDDVAFAVPALAVDQAEVTAGDYAACVDDGACTEPDRGPSCTYGIAAKASHPVNCVDYEQAVAFCAWRGMRLPTESQWEWIARQGASATTFPWGDDEPDTQVCWAARASDPDPEDGPCPVGAFPGGDTGDGVFDLAGNVFEWTAADVPPTDASTTAGVRGGGWASFEARQLEASFRLDKDRVTRAADVGFRCLRGADGAFCADDRDCTAVDELCAGPVCLVARGAQARDEMVALAGGTYRDAGVVQTVAPFELDRAEVTAEEYSACVLDGACTEPGAAGLCNIDEIAKANHPVNCVDWQQATAFCAWEGKRLPTKYEFEWAARGGAAETKYPWGDDEPASRACWAGRPTDADVTDGTCPTGAFPDGDSPDGVYDLAGNVQEWTSTLSSSGDGTRILQGGSWQTDVADSLAARAEFGGAENFRGLDLGFRCAR